MNYKHRQIKKQQGKSGGIFQKSKQKHNKTIFGLSGDHIKGLSPDHDIPYHRALRPLRDPEPQ